VINRLVFVLAALFALPTLSRAQEACPPPHDDYRKPVPVWAGFGYQVNACPGDKVEVAAALVVARTGDTGVIKIPQTLPWNVDLSGLPRDQIEHLRDKCENDLPCAGHFKITILRIERGSVTLKPGE
jgi:hypothetical protein